MVALPSGAFLTDLSDRRLEHDGRDQECRRRGAPDILLWPFPILFAVSALAQIRWRWAAIAAASALLLMNVLVVNQYILQFERDGAAQNFTDALFTPDQAAA